MKGLGDRLLLLYSYFKEGAMEFFALIKKDRICLGADPE